MDETMKVKLTPKGIEFDVDEWIRRELIQMEILEEDEVKALSPEEQERYGERLETRTKLLEGIAWDHLSELMGNGDFYTKPHYNETLLRARTQFFASAEAPLIWRLTIQTLLEELAHQREEVRAVDNALSKANSENHRLGELLRERGDRSGSNYVHPDRPIARPNVSLEAGEAFISRFTMEPPARDIKIINVDGNWRSYLSGKGEADEEATINALLDEGWKFEAALPEHHYWTRLIFTRARATAPAADPQDEGYAAEWKRLCGHLGMPWTSTVDQVHEHMAATVKDPGPSWAEALTAEG